MEDDSGRAVDHGMPWRVGEQFMQSLTVESRGTLMIEQYGGSSSRLVVVYPFLMRKRW